MTLEEIFSLDNFNVIEDTNNYYFFRALNKGDNNDIESGITLDSNSEIERIRTDRERYAGIPKYNEDSKISLQEMHDHIKMHHSIDTNCISLTSNANAAVIYGRGYYQDKYIMVKVPKNELGNKVVNAGLYMMQEIEKIIDNYISNNELDSDTISYLQKIDNVKTQEELLSILQVNNIDEITDTKEIPTTADNMFQKGITYKVTKSINAHYKALNDEQNLEKNKLIAKLHLLNKRILPNVNNTFLIQTIGNAFSALELIHYGDITKEELIDIQKEIVDIFSLLQQLPKDYPYIEEIKEELLKNINMGNINIPNYQDKKLNIEDDYTIEKMYQLTGGHIDYETSTETYKKSFFLAKSKLRTLYMVNTLNSILGNNPKYHDTLRYILNNTYGVEPEIAFRHSSNTLQISESISLDFKKEEKELFDLIDNLNTNDLQTITNNPLGTLQYLLKNLSYIKENPKDRETYYANAIIDLFDWSKLDIVEFYPSQRNDLVQKLKENHCLELYNLLKERGVKEKDIANTLLTIAIKQKDLSSIDLKDTFTTDELEQFLGYYRINATEINLRNYQATALKNIDKAFQKKQFVSAILPTGAGKSFVALAEMLEHKDKEIFYLAPNDSILEQIENYIVKYIHGETVTKSKKNIIKEVFPNLKLQTYSGLLSFNQQEYINHKYDLIVFDELHRSGAFEWKRKVEELLQNQDSNVRVLGITATPQRDADMVDMAEYWAKYYGYTEEEISNHKHMAINMDLVDAIKLGYVVNPKVVNCEYTLKDGELIENLLERINLVKDEDKKNELLTKFEKLRRSLDLAEGIEKVLTSNIKKGGKYMVFCPITNQNNQAIEDIDGITEDSRISGNDVIEKYTKQIQEYLKNSGLDDIEFYSMLGSYSKARNSNELSNFEIGEPDKTKFMVVMNKLNEGVHVKDIDGIIWFRPLDENSKILYLQQLGRIIYGIDPNNEYPNEQRPLAIDLVNNTLRVNMHKNKGLDTNDLDLLHVVCDWMKEHDNQIPDINSSNKIESRYASILKRIQEKYSCYLENNELLNSLDSSNLKEVQAIIELGMIIDLWGISIPEKIKTATTKEQDIEIEPFEVSGILRDFCELDEEIDKNITPLSFDEKLKEIYDLAEGKIENVPKSYELLKFSDNSSVIAGWIKSNRENIKKRTFEGDKYAILIAKSRGWLSVMEDRLKEIYEISEGKVEKIPKSTDYETRFKDGTSSVGSWIGHNSRQIKKLAEEGNECAILVAKAKGWLNPTIEEKLKEIYDLAEGKVENVPTGKNYGIKFNDNSAIIGSWINNNSKTIKKLVREGNEHAILVAKAKGWMDLTFEEKLKEIYDLAEGKVENIPPGKDREKKFSDDSCLIGIWISNNANEIKKMASNGNKHAILVAKSRGWLDLTFEERLKEIYDLTEGKVENIPSEKDREKKFSDNGSLIGIWISNNADEIKKMASEGNKYAILVAKAKGWLDLTFEEKLKEIYDLAEGKVENIPNSKNKGKKFSDDSAMISPWIYVHSEKIKKLAIAGNKHAILVAKARGWLEVTFEEKLKEIYDLAEGEIENVPTGKNHEKKFSDDGVIIGYWIERNSERIKKLAKKGNKWAIFVSKARGWIRPTVEEKLKDLYDLVEGKIENVPSQSDVRKFNDDSVVIGNWIKRNSNEIKKLAIAGNKHAILVAKAKGWLNPSVEEKLKEIWDISGGKEENIPRREDDLRFSDNSSAIGDWIKRNHKEIVHLALEGNEHAFLVAKAKGWLISTFEEKLKEIYDLAEGEIENVPKQHDIQRFDDDSATIGTWINYYSEKIKKLASDGNKYAILIARAKGWSNLNFEEKLKEIYEISEGKEENVPKYGNPLRFTDKSSIICSWIKHNASEIKKFASEGNEHAILVANARGWLNFEKTKESFEEESTFKKVEESIGKKKPKETKNNKGEEVNGRQI